MIRCESGLMSRLLQIMHYGSQCLDLLQELLELFGGDNRGSRYLQNIEIFVTLIGVSRFDRHL